MNKLFLLAICVEVLTELVVEAKIFTRPREWFMSKSVFLSGLLSCGFCTSVWVATALTLLSILPRIFGRIGFYISISGYLAIDLFLQMLILVGLANYIHRLSSSIKYYILKLREIE